MTVILVAVDFSPCALQVVDAACRLARGLDGRLVLLHAAEAPRGVAAGARVHPRGTAEIRTVSEALTEDAQVHLEPLAEHARAAGVATSIQVVMGDPAESVLAAAETLNADWVVVGTHARTGLARAVLGSVAEHVIRRATVPVVTVRNRTVCEVDHTDLERAIAAESDG